MQNEKHSYSSGLKFFSVWQLMIMLIFHGRVKTFVDVVRVTFPVAKDLGGEYSLAQNDQRHRVVLNGIWEWKYGLQVSGLYFYGSGSRFSTNFGTDQRDLGGIGAFRLRPNQTIVANYGSYATPEVSALYGKPSSNPAVAYRRGWRSSGSD